MRNTLTEKETEPLQMRCDSDDGVFILQKDVSLEKSVQTDGNADTKLDKLSR